MLYIYCILIVIIDQVSKQYFVNLLSGGKTIQLIGDFLQLNYVENYGAAFGILQNKKIFFIIITVVVLSFIIYFIKRYNVNFWTKFSLTMIIAGAIGNLIDRVRLSYVIDFIDVKFGILYDFPVFNIADSFIVVGTILLAYLVLTNKYMMKE
ncbi:signal peptidase II [Abyssisolibacter fermentans]|uniref:signal peptidase II n=1 Tax=Abyssisolibacter fermentans TaxID=1766203 RepID=UPI00083294EB|nr:signal peptidase II [Abyssisolibacter fermentans]